MTTIFVLHPAIYDTRMESVWYNTHIMLHWPAHSKEMAIVAVAREEELYFPIKDYYEKLGYTVRGEVLHCDLVAIHEDSGHTVIVEMKKTFTLALLLQGVERLRLNEHVVLAVERNRKKKGAHNQRFGDLAELCRRLGLGLMSVTFYKTKAPFIEILCEPGEEAQRGARRGRQKRLMTEFHERSGDYNVGGSTGRKLMTAYREKAIRIAYTLQMSGTLAPREVAAMTGNSRSGDMLRANYYGWFNRIELGKYQLSAKGAEALIEYRDIIEASDWVKSISSSQ